MGLVLFLCVKYNRGREASADMSIRICPQLPFIVKSNSSFSGCAILYTLFPISLSFNSLTIFAIVVKAGFSQCWIKRGDFHAMHKEDVSYVRHTEEAQEVLQEYFLRGIKRAVINRHLVGDLIKFYGVQGTPFFFWFYPFDEGHSKYGHEAINGRSKGIEFDINRLQRICQSASEVLDVKIYGGDCIVSPEGDIRIIDFNDWPSFAPCRTEAAPHIARCIMNAIKAFKS